MVRFARSLATAALVAAGLVTSAPVRAAETISLHPELREGPEVRHEAHRRARARPRVVRRGVVLFPRIYVRGGTYYYVSRDDHGRDLEVEVPKSRVRARRASLGVGGGALMGLAGHGEGFADPGLLLDLRYRFVEYVGTELRVGFHGDVDPMTQRVQVPIQGSLTFHTPAFIPVGLVAAVGITADVFQADLTGIGGANARGIAVGPHAGLGVRFNLGPRVELDVDARVVGYLTPTGWGEGGLAPVGLTATGMLHFYL